MKFTSALLFATVSAVKLQFSEEDRAEVVAAVTDNVVPEFDHDESGGIGPVEVFTTLAGAGFPEEMAADAVDEIYEHVDNDDFAQGFTDVLGHVAGAAIEAGFTEQEVEDTLRGCIQDMDEEHCANLQGFMIGLWEASKGDDAPAAGTALAQGAAGWTADDQKAVTDALGTLFTDLESKHGNGNGRLDSAEVAGAMKAMGIPKDKAAQWQKEFDAATKGKGASKADVVAFAANHIKEVADKVIADSNGTVSHDDVRNTMTGCWSSGDPESAPCKEVGNALAAHHGLGK